MCVHQAVRAFRFVLSISCSFFKGLRNSLIQMFTMMGQKIQVSVAKVKVLVQDQRPNNKFKHSFVSITFIIHEWILIQLRRHVLHGEFICLVKMKVKVTKVKSQIKISKFFNIVFCLCLELLCLVVRQFLSGSLALRLI
jgi:hypothetical protein